MNEKKKIYRPHYHKNRSQESEPVGESLRKMFERYGLEDKIQSASISSVWKDTMGKFIHERTKKVWLLKNVLHISLSSAPLKKEMQLNQKNVINMVNEKMGVDVVTELKIY